MKVKTHVDGPGDKLDNGVYVGGDFQAWFWCVEMLLRTLGKVQISPRAIDCGEAKPNTLASKLVLLALNGEKFC